MSPIKTRVDSLWDKALPTLKEYIKIPAISPAYHANWEEAGHLDRALDLALDWVNGLGLNHAHARILKVETKTPVLLVEIDAAPGADSGTTLLYGHMDKQPEAHGWDANKGPWTPVMEDDKLYGRGSGDDGYALFAALIAIKALQDENIPHGRCVLLIETCEESGSFDLDHYLYAYAERIGTPKLIICLDSGCGDWERLWITTSLRGLLEVNLSVSLIDQTIHSGNSGLVASSFRILRQLLDRIEDAKTGELHLKTLNTPIPDIRWDQAQKTASVLTAPLSENIPLVPGGKTMAGDTATLLINSTWRPALSYIAAQGIPGPDVAANALRPATQMTLSFRTPPSTDTQAAFRELKEKIEMDPPYGARVELTLNAGADGWDMAHPGQAIENRIQKAARACFGHDPCFRGNGGSIPFMTLLSQQFPRAEVLITGVLGPHANAHGPNEFLHIPYVKKLTTAVAHILGDL